MNRDVRQFLLTQNIKIVKRYPLDLISVKDAKEGAEVLNKLLYFLIDCRTALFLSGGKTPKDAYTALAFDQNINPGVVAMVDERYGKPMHSVSNEKILEDSGLLKYFENKNIPFYNVLRESQNLENTALQYDEKVRVLFSNFPKSVGVLGVGVDGHTASLTAGIKNSKLKIQNYVTEISDFPIEPRERITLTFKALSQMDLLIVLVLGSAKQNALKMMFGDGPVDEIPARFFMRKDIAPKTLLITDQEV